MMLRYSWSIKVIIHNHQRYNVEVLSALTRAVLVAMRDTQGATISPPFRTTEVDMVRDIYKSMGNNVVKLEQCNRQ